MEEGIRVQPGGGSTVKVIEVDNVNEAFREAAGMILNVRRTARRAAYMDVGCNLSRRAIQSKRVPTGTLL